MNRMIRPVSILLAVAILTGLTACNVPVKVSTVESNEADTETPEITSKEMTYYLCTAEDTRKMPVYFCGDSDVPYISLEDWAELFPYLMHTYIYEDRSISYELDCSFDGNTGTLMRTDTDAYTMTVDCDADTITFDDYDAFVRPGEGRSMVDTLPAGGASTEESMELFKRARGSYERFGNPLTVDLSSYGIDMAANESGVYIPMQTLSDLLLSLKYANLYYNGDAVFYARVGDLASEDSKEPTPLGELFYSAEKRERSEAMGAFCYNELCLAFDYMYGLKDSHGIAGFDELARQTGTKEALMGTDSDAADEALYYLIFIHLDDIHSTFGEASPWSRDGLSQEMIDSVGVGRSYLSSVLNDRRYMGARERAYPDGVPAYEEVGNTAYITFDSFIPSPDGVDYHKTGPSEDATDTIGIMTYAYSQIMRSDSPIENVVLDLSCNGGGDADTAIFVISAFLGEGYGSVRNTMTGAISTGVYHVDLNLDGNFDKDDCGLTGKKLFCLTSPSSFSCGNFVPCVFKNSDIVKVIGRTSGGGSCIVLPLTTANGTAFRISGPNRLSYTRNGSFCDIDGGAEPDVVLEFPETFYDRKELTKTINGLR